MKILLQLLMKKKICFYQNANRILSNLGLKTPLSKVPFLVTSFFNRIK